MLVFSEIMVNVPMQARMLVVVVRGDRAWDGRGGTKGGQEMPLYGKWTSTRVTGSEMEKNRKATPRPVTDFGQIEPPPLRMVGGEPPSHGAGQPEPR